MSVSEINQDNFKKEVKESDIPVIVDFWADWCMPCKMMAPEFKKLSEEYDGELKFAKLNTEQNRNLVSQFSIRGIPCLIIFDKGEEVDRIVGFAKKTQLKNKVDSILERIK